MKKDQLASNREIERKLHEQKVLLEVTNSLISTLDLDKTLQIISDGMADLLEIETSAIYLIEDHQMLYLGATTPPLDPKMPDELRKARIEDHPNIKQAIKSGKAHTLPDAHTAELSPAEKIVVELRNLRSILYLPFLKKDEIIGILILGTSNKSRHFYKYEIDLCQTIANQLSLGIQNAQFHAEIMDYNEELKQQVLERMNAEKALRRSEAKLSEALRIVKLGHFQYSHDKDEFTFTDEFYDIFKTSAKEMNGYTMSSKAYAEKFVHPEDRYLVGREIAKAIQSEEKNYRAHVEHKVFFGDGTEGHIAVYIRIIKNEEGEVLTALGVNQDITQQKEAEQELRTALDKAKESDLLKSAFLANMSHEIRTPLNAILGFSALLNNPELSEQKRKDYIEIINFGGKRLLNIISDILDISKIDAKQLSLSRSVFNINELIDNLLTQFRINAGKNNNRISAIKALDNSNSYILCDYSRISQVLSNLIENALKFTKNGKVVFGYTRDKDILQFYVRDTGIGIEQKYFEKIFDRFMQVDNEYTLDGSGTGLGLSIARGIVELLGGKIWVESEKGKGSAFYFEIPYKTARPTKEEKELDVIYKAKDRKITLLIAEDEHSSFLYLKEILESYNCSIIHAENGKEALDAYDKNPDIDMIFMDLKMPTMGGVEAIKILRKKDKVIPIVAQTAYAMPEDREIAFSAGSTDYITKPINSSDLNTILTKYIK